MRDRSLAEWLAYAETVHRVGIDMGLGRVAEVARRMGLGAGPRYVVVAGTNGKGSTTMFCEALLRARRVSVGTLLSPHLHRFNERIRLDGEEADDATICAGFAAVDAGRGEIPLTYFEFSVLVALQVFRHHGVDVAVLEVGLGGRLDAVNLVDADVAVITSIGLDHQEYLGDDPEQIGREKAGILRRGVPAVLGRAVTASVVEAAAALECPVRRAGQEFELRCDAANWEYRGAAGHFPDLPWGALAPDNCALAIEAVAALRGLSPGLSAPSETEVRQALRTAALPGRCETREFRQRLLVVDVAHNPAGAAFLAQLLGQRFPGRRWTALLGTLADKDSAAVAAALAGQVDAWLGVSTTGPRGLGAEPLCARIRARVPDGVPVEAAADIAAALSRAVTLTPEGSGILAFGSFNLVEQVRDRLESDAPAPESGAPAPVSGAPAPDSEIAGSRIKHR